MTTGKCGSTLSRCVCHRRPHGDDTPHRCGEPFRYGDDGCGGSWFGNEDEPDKIEIVSYPRLV